MADYYVRSGASGAANGSTWADAYTTIEAGAEAVSGSNNTLYVADGHSESHASAVTLALGGDSISGPMRVLSVNDTGDPAPPTALAAGALVATTGANSLTVDGVGQVVGMHFKAGDGASTANLNIGSGSNDALLLRNCTLEVGSTSGTATMAVGSASTANGRYELQDCTLTMGSANQEILVRGANARLIIRGGALAGAALTRVFSSSTSYPASAEIIGLDLSAAATAAVLVDGLIAGQSGQWVLASLTLPASWSGSLINNTPLPSCRVDMIDSTDGTTRYRRWIETPYGSIRDTVHLGASVYLDDAQYDGDARYSLRFAASDRANNQSGHLVGPDMHAYAETAAASTATVQILHDGASALTNADCWLEVFVDGQWISGERANPLAAGTAHTASAETWTGDSGTGPNGSATWNRLKLTCGFTPSAAGPVMGRVVLAKASTTIYADINLTVTVD